MEELGKQIMLYTFSSNLDKQMITISLSRVSWIRLVKQVLYPY